MKKIFTLFTIFFLTTTISFAQVQIGPTAGLNMSNITGSDLGESKSKMGMHLGLSANFYFSDAMSLNTGLLYSIKGAQDEDEGAELTATLSYIEIPVNLSFSLSDQLSLMVGPYIGLLMAAEIEISGTGLFDGTIDMKDDTRSMDYGISLGARFSVVENISINAGYQIGLATLDPEGSGDDKNSNILFGVTYLFGDSY